MTSNQKLDLPNIHDAENASASLDSDKYDMIELSDGLIPDTMSNSVQYLPPVSVQIFPFYRLVQNDFCCA
ncbi:hypothetical protein [Undibacterium sp. 5I1]|uniref:hypothetical protein n=1 Tax=Undibacterium sp. 5I1 TaxID=3048590 RepID=UPI002B239005|nr:hypothetical protein [Undibacterium sp. 5I1]